MGFSGSNFSVLCACSLWLKNLLRLIRLLNLRPMLVLKFKARLFGAFVLGGLALAAQGIGAQPAAKQRGDAGVVRTRLAGAEFNAEKSNFRKFDARQGYYLVRQNDGAGRTMVVSLYLFPDPAKNGGYRSGFTNRSIKTQSTQLPSVRRGWGVNIGDTPQQVRKSLGRAPDFSQPSAPKLLYVYKAPIRLNIGGKTAKWQYTARYIFDRGHLRVIEYEARDPITEF